MTDRGVVAGRPVLTFPPRAQLGTGAWLLWLMGSREKSHGSLLSLSQGLLLCATATLRRPQSPPGVAAQQESLRRPRFLSEFMGQNTPTLGPGQLVLDPSVNGSALLLH